MSKSGLDSKLAPDSFSWKWQSQGTCEGCPQNLLLWSPAPGWILKRHLCVRVTFILYQARVKCFIPTHTISKAKFLIVSGFRDEGFSGCKKAIANSKKVTTGSMSLGGILFPITLQRLCLCLLSQAGEWQCRLLLSQPELIFTFLKLGGCLEENVVVKGSVFFRASRFVKTCSCSKWTRPLQCLERS